MATFWKKGDIVVIKKKSGIPRPWSDSHKMWEGKEVVIGDLRTATFSTENPVGLSFRYSDIERCADETRELERQKYYNNLYENRVYEADKVRLLAESVFGEERVWVDPHDSSSFDIYIHFPELEIVNSRNSRHTITNLYVNFKVEGIDIEETNSNICSILCNGDRQTLTIEEYSSKYLHSHLPSMRNDNFGYKTFCLGASNFGQILVEVSMNMSEESWMMLFLSLESYLKWESLEGGPYIQMRNISLKGNRLSIRDVQSELIKVVKDLPTDIWDFREANAPKVVPGDSSLYDYLDKTFGVRSLSGNFSKEYRDSYTKRANNILSKFPIKWKKTTLNRSIVENPKAETKKEKKIPLSREVVSTVEEILSKNIITYINNIRHEKARKEKRERVFRSSSYCSLK